MAKSYTTKAYEHEYEKFVDKGAFYYKHHTKSREEFSYLGLGVAGEAGECADAIKKMTREENFRFGYDNHILKAVMEASDNLWYITRICQVAGITLEDLRIMNTVKLFDRLRANGKEEFAHWPYQAMTYAQAKDHVRMLEDQIEGVF